MRSLSELRPGSSRQPGFQMVQVTEPCPELNRFFYASVGGDHFWIDRLTWSHAQWMQTLAAPGYETWMGTIHGVPAGFFELAPSPDGASNIHYFGLLKQYAGRGIGGAMLTAAVRRAWQTRPQLVTLNTCTLDSPVALANYRARGFVVVREQLETAELPEASPGLWPGAHVPVQSRH